MKIVSHYIGTALICTHQLSKYLDSADLESTWNLGLENTSGIVLGGNSADVLHVLGAITSQRILGLIGVVQVDELVIGSNRLGIGIQLRKSTGGQLVEQGIIGRVLPGVIVENLCTRLLDIYTRDFHQRLNLRNRSSSKRSRPSMLPPLATLCSVNTLAQGWIMVNMV